MSYYLSMWKHLLQSQKGFSIIQGMFLAGAVAGMAYVGTKLTTDQKLMQKGIEAKGRVEQLHDMIYSVLQNRDHCATTLSLNNLTAAANLSNTGVQTLTGIATAGTAALSAAAFKTNSSATYDPALVYMNNTVSIKNMAITYPSNFANPATLSLTYARLEDTNSARRTGKGTGTKEITKKISLKIQRGGSGEFKSCYAVTSLENEDMIKDFCEDIGADGNDATPSLFTWNASLQTCQLRDLKCASGFVYAGFDSNGNPRCNRIENWMNFNDVIDPTPVDCFDKEVSLKVVGQKITIDCAGAATTCVEGTTKLGPLVSKTYNTTYCGAGGGSGALEIREWVRCQSNTWVSNGGYKCYQRTQAACVDPSKPTAPASGAWYCSYQDSCATYAPSSNQGTNANGTFNFCTWSWIP